MTQLSQPLNRIVSLVPSITELLFGLGLDAEVVGITKFCVHPDDWRRTKARVGGTKNVHVDVVRDLNPSLVLANKEENVKEQVEALQAFTRVYVSEVPDLAGALEMIREVGELTARAERAEALAAEIEKRFASLETAPGGASAAYFIWRNPWMTAGGDTFIHDMLSRAGFRNAFSAQTRYPKVDGAALKAANPCHILLSSEPYPFREKHVDEFRTVLPNAQVLLVDGEMFSWYGSRLLEAPAYFAGLRKLVDVTKLTHGI